jgi:N-acetylmuramoyl-L-alanine amidase
MKKYIVALLVLTAHGQELQKVFHHIVSGDFKAPADIELSKIVFYFSGNGITVKKDIVPLADKKDFVHLSLFIPHVAITSAEAKKMVNMLNANKNELYTAHIAAVQKPAAGIEFALTYNKAKVAVSYDTFDAITGAKGLEVRLYNKTLLDAIKQKKQDVLRTARNKPTVIIDCGHGGSDSGTTGFFESVEKNITLAVGMELAQELKKNGYSVLLTRADDTFVALDQRTTFANTQVKNGILLSLHANNAANNKICGLETYCLSPSLFKKPEPLLETALDVLVNDHDQMRYENSKQLAHYVHQHILDTVTKEGYCLRNRSIRNAATQVLMGTQWPAILVEMEYLSNENGAKFLLSHQYQKAIIAGICQGVQEYCKKIT